MARPKQASQELLEELDELEEELEEELSTSTFDVNKYKITNAVEKQTLYIDGTSFEVTVKPLSWSLRNQILSKSLKWDSNGSTVFDGDSYVRSCLKEMIIEAPWGRTTESFLISIDARLGTCLEQLVPKAFDEGEGADVEQIKKEL